MGQPSLAGRILKLIPGDYDLQDLPLEALPPNTYSEDALVQLDSDEEVWISNPSIERSYVGRRCLLELNAAFGDCELITEQAWLKEQGISNRNVAGKISSSRGIAAGGEELAVGTPLAILVRGTGDGPGQSMRIVLTEDHSRSGV